MPHCLKSVDTNHEDTNVSGSSGSVPSRQMEVAFQAFMLLTSSPLTWEGLSGGAEGLNVRHSTWHIWALPQSCGPLLWRSISAAVGNSLPRSPICTVANRASWFPPSVPCAITGRSSVKAFLHLSLDSYFLCFHFASLFFCSDPLCPNLFSYSKNPFHSNSCCKGLLFGILIHACGQADGWTLPALSSLCWNVVIMF